MATLITGLASSVFYDTAVGGSTRVAALTNGIDRMYVVDGINAYEMGIDVPPAVATFNSNINGSLDESANYYYDFTNRRSIHGIIGNGAGTSAVMTTGNSSNDGIRLDIGADSAIQTGIDQIEVYRTLGGGTVKFYEGRKAYSGSAITYDSTIADSALGSSIVTDNTVPQTRPYIIYFDGRFVTLGSKTHSAGTVAVTNNSTTITFTSASVTRGHEGARFNITADGSKFYTISSVNVTAQTAVISAVYGGSTDATATYTISRKPMILNWSKIDSSANLQLESFPSTNFDDFGGGQDNEKSTGLGKTTSFIIPFTNYSTYYTSPAGANTFYKTKVLYPGVGLMNFRTIANDPKKGDLFWLDQNANVQRSNGTREGIFNLSEHFVGNILDGTHVGIHRNLKVDTSKYADFHGIYYGTRGWYMLFITLSGSTYPNACLIFNEKINPTGNPQGPSPWMLWTGFNAVSSNMELDSDGILRPFFGDDLGFKWQMDTGTNDYGSSTTGKTTTGNPTASDATSMTDSAATFPTAGDGLKGTRVQTYNGTTDALENDEVIQSNSATKLTVTSWDSTPTTGSAGSVYVVGGIIMQRYSKIFHDGSPKSVKQSQYLYMTADDTASSTRNLKVYYFKDFSSTAEVTAGREVDVSAKPTHKVNIRARGHHHQYLLSNHFADQPIEVFDIDRKVTAKGDH